MATTDPRPVPLRRLPAATGWSFLVAGFAARLPQAMTPMGVLLLLASAASGGYGLGGLALAGYSAGCAIGGPVLVLSPRGMATASSGRPRPRRMSSRRRCSSWWPTHAVAAAVAVGWPTHRLGRSPAAVGPGSPGLLTTGTSRIGHQGKGSSATSSSGADSRQASYTSSDNSSSSMPAK